MSTIIEGLRSVLGVPDFLLEGGAYDYGSMLEYLVGAVILCIVVSSVFRFVIKVVDR